MLKRVTLKNFRKHLDATLDFDSGFSVIRGENEAGKSTFFEAIAYALFGVGALRTSLSKAVTWGQPESSLKVVLTLEVDGVEYSISRAKPGCECSYKDQLVTGQKEVTNFMGRALRMDINAAKRLVLSNQKEIAGALEAGPKATTEMIERLADFHQIDRLLDLMEQKLTLGSDASLKARLEAAQHQLVSAKDNVEPDWAALQTGVDNNLELVDFREVAVSREQSTADKAQAAAAKSAAAQSERGVLAKREARLRDRSEAADLEAQNLSNNPVPDAAADDQIQALMAHKADAESQARITRIYEQVKGLCGKQGIEYFAGSKSEFDLRTAQVDEAITESKETLRSSDHAVKLLLKDRESGNCTFCGKNFSDLPEVKAKNARIQEKIDGHSEAIRKAQQALDKALPEHNSLVALRAAAQPYLSAAERYPEHVQADGATFPPVLGWLTTMLEGTLSAEQIDAQIKVLRLAQTAHRNWLSAVKVNEDLVKSLRVEVGEVRERSLELGDGDNADHATTLASALQALQVARSAMAQATTALSDSKGAQRDEKRRWEHALATVAAAQKVVDTSEEEIKVLAFNNTLQKVVRAARPAIADRLWALVLTSVSTYFSEIRGVKSVVSKGPDGFLIDGEPVESFSGSTIDSLGLAIRVALVRTFLPTAPFLILDEPAAACSAERTENMLGFIVGAGFRQILLITHEDVSENVADNIITLGEEA